MGNRLEMKTCTQCGKEKRPTEFHLAGKGRMLGGEPYRRPNCKRCHSMREAKRLKEKRAIKRFLEKIELKEAG